MFLTFTHANEFLTLLFTSVKLTNCLVTDQSQRHLETFSWHWVVAFARWCNAEAKCWLCVKARSEAVTLDGEGNSREVWKTVSQSRARTIWPGFGSASVIQPLVLLWDNQLLRGNSAYFCYSLPRDKGALIKIAKDESELFQETNGTSGPKKLGQLVCGGDSLIVLLVLFQAGLCPQQRIKKPGLIHTSLFCFSSMWWISLHS